MKRIRTFVVLVVAALAFVVVGFAVADRRLVRIEHEAVSELAPTCRCGADAVGVCGVCARKALAQLAQIKDVVCERSREVSVVMRPGDGVVRVLAVSTTAQLAAEKANASALAIARRLDDARAESAAQGVRQLSEIADRARRRLKAAERGAASGGASESESAMIAEKLRGFSNDCARAEGDLARMSELVWRQRGGAVLAPIVLAEAKDASEVLVLFGRWRLRLP